jgi:predicted nucleic acid-binding protein
LIYLLDTSGLVRLLADSQLQSAWFNAIDAEAIASCYPQRTEFLYSARDGREYDEITAMRRSRRTPDAGSARSSTAWPRQESIAAPRRWTSS